MLKVKPKILLFFSGLIWLAVGFSLLQLGLKLLGIYEADSAVAWMAVALFIGYFKGKYVLRKSAEREVSRIYALTGKPSILQLYSPKYYLLLLLMMGLGMAFNFFGINPILRGVIDTAVGIALLNGSFVYFRAAIYDKDFLSGSRMHDKSALSKVDEPVGE